MAGQQQLDVPSTSGAAAAAVGCAPHPMRNLHTKRFMLEAIDENWLNDHNVRKRFTNCQGFCGKAKGFFRLSIMGCIFQARNDDLDLSQDEHIFDCAYADCRAQVRVHNERLNFAKVTKRRPLKIDNVDIELLQPHTCAIVEYQTIVLKYLDIIRYHLVQNKNAELNSHTGFFIFQENVGLRGILNAPIGIYDHLFSWRGRSPSNSATHFYCNNGLNVTCCVNKNSPCGAIVDVYTRQIYTCQVTGRSGTHSKDIPNSNFVDPISCADFERAKLKQPSSFSLFL